MYLFFDTETTGLPKNWKAPITDFENWPRLVQLAYQIFDDYGTLIKEGDFIVKPSGFTIPTEASSIHGITNERAYSEGKSLSKVLEEFKFLLDEAHTIVAHNVSFDEKIIGCEYLRLNLSNPLVDKDKICTMESSTDYCAISGPYGYKWPKLSELHSKLFNSDFEEAHNAIIDIQATSKCFWELVRLNVIKLSEIIQPSKQNEIEPCFIEKDGVKKYGYFLADSKKVVIKCEYEYASPFKANYAMVIYRGKIRYVTKGGLLIEPVSNSFSEFPDGLSAASIALGPLALTDEKMYGFIDTSIIENLVVIPFIYERVHEFSEGLASVRKDGRFGFINIKGENMIPFIYEFAGDFQYGHAVVKKNGKWGIINKENNEVMPIMFDGLISRPDYYSYHIIQKDKKRGYYDKQTLKITIPIKYDDAGFFYEKLACVKLNDKYGFIDENGIERIPFIYDDAKRFSEGLACVKIKDKWGFINKDGNQIIPFIYFTAKEFDKGKAKIQRKPTFIEKGVSILTLQFKNLKIRDGYIDNHGVQYWED